MDELVINPQLSDTGAMGHISNTTLPVWFQEARRAMFRRVPPSADQPDWPLLVVRYEVELSRQMYPGAPVTIRTGVEGFGNSSIRVVQQAWQHGQLAATGLAVLVHFDDQTQRSRPLTPAMRELLSGLLVAHGEEMQP